MKKYEKFRLQKWGTFNLKNSLRKPEADFICFVFFVFC